MKPDRSALIDIVEALCDYPNRSADTPVWDSIFESLKSFVPADVKVEAQPFQTPKNFLIILTWLFGGFIVSIGLSFLVPILAMLIGFFLVIAAFLYFDWRVSPILKFPPLTTCHNFLARKPVANPAVKIILMAHWDTAPITYPYRRHMIKGFRSSVFAGMFVMCLALATVGLRAVGIQSNWLLWTQVGLAAYFTIQLLVIYIDYWKYGYSNGANDNATGCAAALQVANELWSNQRDVEVEVCITGAEEVGMVGAKAYYESQKRNVIPIFVINFDTIGCENLQVITESGTFSRNSYDSPLLQQARIVAKDCAQPINFAKYETADVDTVWFARGGIPAITLISYDDEGLPAYIHRPEDTMDKIHWNSVECAAAFALDLCETLIDKHPNA